MTTRAQWQIGTWTFDAVGARLIAGEIEIPLEHRAARTLEMLCRSRGSPVSRDEILADVWEGRSVSPNSVAVVIADLRRALGDDASAPRFIATIPKRGYRLSDEAPPVAAPAPAAPARRNVLRSLAIAVAVIALVGTGFLAMRSRSHDRVTLVVTPTANDTGKPQYRPLAIALQALLTDRLSRMGVDVLSAPTPPGPVQNRRQLWFRSRLILWNGISTLSMEEVDGSGRVTWTGMAVAPPNGLAAATIAQLRTLKVEALDR